MEPCELKMVHWCWNASVCFTLMSFIYVHFMSNYLEIHSVEFPFLFFNSDFLIGRFPKMLVDTHAL